ncbi:MAG: helix-turn-helix transcriptional regulator [Candidatus Methylomirabilales bacterium]
MWRHRKAQRLAQKQVALLLGHKKTGLVSLWENAEDMPTLRNAITLAIIFNAPVEALFSGLTSALKEQVKARAAASPLLAHRVPHLYDAQIPEES